VTLPLTPGHEICGVVREVGSGAAAASGFKVGDVVGVGCMVECCRNCHCCKTGKQQFCDEGIMMTYGSKFPAGRGDNYDDCVGVQTNGGYSTDITLNHEFVFPLPSNMEPEWACVLFCAGITMYSPLKRYVQQAEGGPTEKKIAVVGFGGLGHLGLKIARAMGVPDVTIISRDGSKTQSALEMGASRLVSLADGKGVLAKRTYDVVFDTQPAGHDIADLVGTLKVGGQYVMIGVHSRRYEIDSMQMIFNMQSVVGSMIGGLEETREMLDFCSEHGIVPEYEVIAAKDAYEHFKALAAGKVDAMRAVIDMSTLRDMVPTNGNKKQKVGHDGNGDE